jgi:hypothetical protein
MSELPLDHHKRHPFVRHLDGVRVPQLMRREATPNSSERSSSPQMLASSGRFPVTASGRAPDDAQQGAD